MTGPRPYVPKPDPKPCRGCGKTPCPGSHFEDPDYGLDGPPIAHGDPDLKPTPAIGTRTARQAALRQRAFAILDAEPNLETPALAARLGVTGTTISRLKKLWRER